jgi:Leucine-rich repeat (LRR) protein
MCFPVLDYLHLFRNEFENVDFLSSYCPVLTYLNIHSNPIKSLPSSLPKQLVYVNLSNCELQNAEPVFELLFCEVLNLSNNKLTNVKGVELLTRLTSLELQKNEKIKQIPNLKLCINLQVLNLDFFRSNNKTKISNWISEQK